MNTEDNREVAKRFIHIWGDGDLQLIDELADPQIEVAYPVLPRTIRGSRLFKRIMEGFRSSFPDSSLRIEETMAEDDRVLVRWTFSGTQSGPLLSFSASGKKVTWTGMTVYHFREGRIARELGEEDMLGFLRQIGEI